MSNRQDSKFVVISMLALLGLADSLYLSVKHFSGESVRCTVTTGCDEVLSSTYSSIAGLPLALLGVAAYFTVFSFAVLIAFGYRGLRPILNGLVAAMLLTTFWLLYVQAFLLDRFCQFCLLSAVVTVAICVILFAGPVISHLRRSAFSTER
jgi:uncharacterized membrane protein